MPLCACFERRHPAHAYGAAYGRLFCVCVCVGKKMLSHTDRRRRRRGRGRVVFRVRAKEDIRGVFVNASAFPRIIC